MRGSVSEYGERWGKNKTSPAATYLPDQKPGSIVGAGGLNFRVRDGNGWVPSAVPPGRVLTN